MKGHAGHQTQGTLVVAPSLVPLLRSLAGTVLVCLDGSCLPHSWPLCPGVRSLRELTHSPLAGSGPWKMLRAPYPTVIQSLTETALLLGRSSGLAQTEQEVIQFALKLAWQWPSHVV